MKKIRLNGVSLFVCLDNIRTVPLTHKAKYFFDEFRCLDANTAQCAQHLYGGIGDVYEYEDELIGTIRCEVVGLLSNSILQGEILMSEENLLELFPDTGGYRFFLFEHLGRVHTRQNWGVFIKWRK